MEHKPENGEAGDMEVTKAVEILALIELFGFNPEFDYASDVVCRVYRSMEIEHRRSISGAYNPAIGDNTYQAKL